MRPDLDKIQKRWLAVRQAAPLFEPIVEDLELVINHARALEDALRPAEWCINLNNGRGPRCPACDGAQSEGHKPECTLYKRLSKLLR